MISRSEARALRKLKKQADAEEKSARLRVAPQGDEVRSEYAKPHRNEVRLGANPNSIFRMQMTWTVEFADRAGSWSWGRVRDWTDETWQTAILPKLTEFAKLTWSEIESFTTGGKERHRMHHDMETGRLIAEAGNRLRAIEQYSDTMFRFRLGGNPRLWGIREVANFKIIWFDPEHEIYPVD